MKEKIQPYSLIAQARLFLNTYCIKFSVPRSISWLANNWLLVVSIQLLISLQIYPQADDFILLFTLVA